MHAIVIRANIHDPVEAKRGLDEEILPRMKDASGPESPWRVWEKSSALIFQPYLRYAGRSGAGTILCC